MGGGTVVAGDLIVAEVLQGFPVQRDLDAARRVFDGLPCVTLGGLYRRLRARRVTVRGVVDALIAGFRVRHRIPLLQSDRDFERHFGLKAVR